MESVLLESWNTLMQPMLSERSPSMSQIENIMLYVITTCLIPIKLLILSLDNKVLQIKNFTGQFSDEEWENIKLDCERFREGTLEM